MRPVMEKGFLVRPLRVKKGQAAKDIPSWVLQYRCCWRQCSPHEIAALWRWLWCYSLVYFQQKGGSVQHIIVHPHTFRMQAQEGQHVSAVKPPWQQLEMHCAGQIDQAISGEGGHGCVVAVSVPNIKEC